MRISVENAPVWLKKLTFQEICKKPGVYKSVTGSDNDQDCRFIIPHSVSGGNGEYIFIRPSTNYVAILNYKAGWANQMFEEVVSEKLIIEGLDAQ